VERRQDPGQLAQALLYCLMVRNSPTARRLTVAEATDLWGRSDEASAFTHPDHLDRLADESEWWGVERAGEIVAAWPLVRAVAGGEIAPPPFCYYVGPMFARSLRDSRYHRYWSGYSAVFAALISTVVSVHPRFSFSMPLGSQDLRVLEWWNFDHPDRVGFSFKPRYTARVDLSQFDTSSAYRCFASNRRKAIRRWAASPPDLVREVDPERLIALHDVALRRSGAVTTAVRDLMLRRLVDLVQSGAGHLLGFRPAGAREAGAVILLLDGPDVSNAVFYGAEPEWRDQGLIAWAVWQGMRFARDSGRRWFDFNGANSPGRAADKHFYGARPELHFYCRFGPDQPVGH